MTLSGAKTASVYPSRYPSDEIRRVRADEVALHDETSEAQCQAQCDQIQVTYPHTNRGILSHPAIIAREYRIPAVVSTGSATELLRDGQIVTVDGTTGVVEVETPD